MVTPERLQELSPGDCIATTPLLHGTDSTDFYVVEVYYDEGTVIAADLEGYFMNSWLGSFGLEFSESHNYVELIEQFPLEAFHDPEIE